jgi:hypothetical protein
LAKNWLAFLEDNFGLLETVDETVERLITGQSPISAVLSIF